MIRKNFTKKLILKKSTISNLTYSQMVMVLGGAVKPIPMSVTGTDCQTCGGITCLKLEQ